jgi:predicted DNA-binding ribbon-helix-helix protein
MRTTLTLEDRLLKELKQIAHETNTPLKEVVEKVLREGLRSLRAAPRPRPHRVKTFRMGRPTGINLDKALDLAAAGEDDELVRKMVLRK